MFVSLAYGVLVVYVYYRFLVYVLFWLFAAVCLLVLGCVV